MLNKVILIGNVGQEPEIKSMSNGNKMGSFSLATSEYWKDKATGERKSKTEWHRIVVYNENLVRVLEQFIHKGSKIYVEGSMKSRKYNDASGAEKTIFEIVIQSFSDTIKLLDNKNDSSGDGAFTPSNNKELDNASSDSDVAIDDDIPF